MSEATGCGICGNLGGKGEALIDRLLVPGEFLSEGLFEIDPLGTAGATVRLCPGCATMLEKPMLIAEDLEAFGRAVVLHQRAHPSADRREGQAARMRLWHRALHLGLRTLVAELGQSAAAPAVSSSPGPDQLGLFVSRTARLARMEAPLSEGRLEEARAVADEIVSRFDLREARYLAGQLGPIAVQVSEARQAPEVLAALAERPELLLDFSRITVSLASAFSRGLQRLAAQAAEEATAR